MSMSRSIIKLMGRNLMCRRTSIKRYTSNIYRHNSTIHSLTFSLRPAYSYMQAYSLCFSPVSTNYSHGKNYGPEEETKGEFDSEQPIRKGDMINLHDLLFRDRDHLVKYNDSRQVKAAELAGKVIVLYFVPLHYDYSWSVLFTTHLTNTYSYLMPENVFEVVLVTYGSGEVILSDDYHSFLKETYEAIFSCMPWTAIPFSDIKSRERLVRRFGIDRFSCYCTSVVIDSTGIVLQSKSHKLFARFGGLGYPFSDERIELIKSEIYATAKNPQLKALLGTPKRDYVISNKGDKVLIDSLKEKVVALYFYEEGITSVCDTKNIITAYEEFAQNKSCFEVVLVYLNDTEGTFYRTSETTYCNTFETMPWLALPFKDPKCGVLGRLFGYPYDGVGPGRTPTLVIIGPDGKFVEPWGADIICQFKLPAFPFNREKLAMLDNEKVRELTLEMLWDQSTIFRGKHGGQVRFSELVGKKIILFFEGDGEDEYRKNKVVKFLDMLKLRYIASAGYWRDEFEVIYITSSKTNSPYNDHIGDAPWLVSHASELLPIDLSVYCCYCHISAIEYCSCKERRRKSSMLAFDEDGRVVRKSTELSIGHLDFPFFGGRVARNSTGLSTGLLDFPFFNGGMEMEAFYEISEFYDFSEADRYHWGLLINSYFKKTYLRHIDC